MFLLAMNMIRMEFASSARNKIRIIGMMTGTSLDGIDCAVVDFPPTSDTKPNFELIADGTYPISTELKALLQKIISGNGKTADISLAHFALAKEYAEASEQICVDNNIDKSSIDALGIHGQTVWHDPSGVYSDMKIGSTLQLCSGSALAQLFGKIVISDFRSADVALGGNGAPLVPIFDFYFLSSEKQNVIALNIGGIANITLLPANCKENEVIAFDTGPGNTLIDSACRKLYNREYDPSGSIARSGKADEDLLSELMQINFISQPPPKSTGRELFNDDTIIPLYNKLNSGYLQSQDIIRTLTEFTAKSIAFNIKEFGFESGRLAVSGGGAKNDFLMELLENELTGFEIVKSDVAGVPADSKEAICFAFLAYLTLNRKSGNLPSATGAIRSAILGSISIP